MSDAPNTKIKPILSPAQVKKWNEIIALIPKENHPYIEKSIKQLKGVQSDY